MLGGDELQMLMTATLTRMLAASQEAIGNFRFTTRSRKNSFQLLAQALDCSLQKIEG